MRILVVDPDSVSRAGVGEIFESRGWAVSACGDLPAALAALAGQTFDVVWTEWDLGGAVATPLLARARDHSPAATLVVVTGSKHLAAASNDLGAHVHDKARTRPVAASLLALGDAHAAADP